MTAPSAPVAADWQALPVPPSLLGESPFWHPDEAALYWCDIPGKALHRWHPAQQRHTTWPQPSEPASMAPRLGGGLLVAYRDGLFAFDSSTGQRTRLCAPPYDPALERYNDGKADAQGRFWVGTIYEPRQPALAAFYCWSNNQLQRLFDGITVSNGLAFSPDGHTLYRSDTTRHRIFAHTLDPVLGTLGPARDWATFEPRQPEQPLQSYAGRPDGAAVDSEGHYWVALFEGQRLLRLNPAGAVVQTLMLPVRCPTMPCFGGPDLKTLFVTTARRNRSADELAQQPLAGCVLALRVPVAGLPVNFVN
jgi:sugar lactone lactonase YvrE